MRADLFLLLFSANKGKPEGTGKKRGREEEREPGQRMMGPAHMSRPKRWSPEKSTAP